MQLRQQNAELTARFQTKAEELRTYEKREQDLSQVLQSIALELPQCNIEFALPLTQKVRRVADRAKALEETVTKMEEDHKAQITELEARAPGTPQADKEARTEAFRLTSTQMKCLIDDVESLLADAMKTWSNLDELPAKLELQQSILNIENAIVAMKEEVKSLGALAKMKNTTEMNHLQQEAQRLRAKEIQFNNLLQPYQEQIAELVDAVEQKVKEFTANKSEIDSAEGPMITQVMLEAAQDRVEDMGKDIAGLKERFAKTSQEAKETLQQNKSDVSGSGTSHK